MLFPPALSKFCCMESSLFVVLACTSGLNIFSWLHSLFPSNIWSINPTCRFLPSIIATYQRAHCCRGRGRDATGGSCIRFRVETSACIFNNQSPPKVQRECGHLPSAKQDFPFLSSFKKSILHNIILLPLLLSMSPSPIQLE